MAHQSTLSGRAASFEDLVRVLLIVAGAIIAMLVLNVVFGFNGTGPSIDLTPNPAAGLDLPF